MMMETVEKVREAVVGRRLIRSCSETTYFSRLWQQRSKGLSAYMMARMRATKEHSEKKGKQRTHHNRVATKEHLADEPILVDWLATFAFWYLTPDLLDVLENLRVTASNRQYPCSE